MNELDNKVAVVGLGKSGISTVAFLVKKGYKPELFDTRENLTSIYENDLVKNNELKVHLGALDENLLKAFSTVIVSPGIPLATPALSKTIEVGVDVVTDIEIFGRFAKAPIIGITGSNGKSTVTTLVYEILKNAGLNAKVGGNIGIPALDILDDKAEAYVLELSSFQLEGVKTLKLKGATILNISEDHLDRYHGKMIEYIDAKRRIFMHAENILVNRDDEFTYPQNNQSVISFGLDDKDYGEKVINGEKFLTKNGEPIMKVSEMGIKGTHNEMNALASIALTDLLNVSRKAQVETLKNFTGLAHRCQLVRELDGVSYYNDSKATNVGATLAAVKGLAGKGKIYLLAGGLGKGQDFTPVKNLLGKEVAFMFCYGRDGKMLSELGKETMLCKDMHDAILKAKDMSEPNSIVLLAPACASLDEFKSFEERGDIFAKIVREL